MSHIIRDNIDLDVLEYFYKNLDIDKLSVAYLEEVLGEFLPRDLNDNSLVKYNIRDKGINPAIYYPGSNNISLSIDKLQSWIRVNSKDLGKFYSVSDSKSFDKYLLLYVLTHEIEHSYQYMMASDKIESPCKLVRDGYKGITDLFIKPSYIIPRPIKQMRRLISLFLYKIHENEYVLERNANIESLDLVCNLAKVMNDEEAFSIFSDMLYTFMSSGYTKSGLGSFYETYKGIFMGDKYARFDKNHDLSFEDCVRYGLSIDEEDRSKVLRMVKKRNYEK